MKSLPASTLLILFLACSSSGNQETKEVDSTALALADTVNIPDLPAEDSGEVEETEDYPEGEHPLEVEYGDWKSKMGNLTGIHLVKVSSIGHESQAETTWDFELDFKPRYFRQEYSTEDGEGTIEFILNEGSVVCASLLEGNTEKLWCAATHGWLDVDGEHTELSQDFGAEQNETVRQYVDELKNIVKVASVMSEEYGILKLEHREAEIIGDAGYERVVSIRIPKVVYDAWRN